MSIPIPTTISGLPTLTINSLNSYIGSFDPINDLFVVYQKSSGSTVNIDRNTALNIASGIVGLTDTQTLTNKTLTSPTISGLTLSGTIIGTYTIGGTPTFPNSVVQLTSTQTLTNKTLTSPTINSPTITNATLSTDAITGFTISTSGTIYGISVSSGKITNAAITNATIGSAQIATNGISATNLATNAISLGYVQITTTSYSNATTSATYVTGLGVQVTIPAGGRNIKVTVQVPWLQTSAAPKYSYLSIWSGTAVGTLTTQLQQINLFNGSTATSNGSGGQCIYVSDTPPAAGTAYFNVAIAADSSSTTTLAGVSATSPAYILVEAI